MIQIQLSEACIPAGLPTTLITSPNNVHYLDEQPLPPSSSPTLPTLPMRDDSVPDRPYYLLPIPGI